MENSKSLHHHQEVRHLEQKHLYWIIIWASPNVHYATEIWRLFLTVAGATLYKNLHYFKQNVIVFTLLKALPSSDFTSAWLEFSTLVSEDGCSKLFLSCCKKTSMDKEKCNSLLFSQCTTKGPLFSSFSLRLREVIEGRSGMSTKNNKKKSKL